MNDIDVDHPWVIVHLSDVHIPAACTLADRVLGPVDRFRQAMNDIERFHPDHLLITGDLTDAGHLDEYDRLKAVLEHAPCPTTIIGGNHDDQEVLSERIAQAPALNGLGATVEGLPIRLVLIASAVPGRRDGEFGPERLRWLDETLGAAPGTPTIVATHHPPLNTGTWWMDYRGPHGQEELEEVIGRHPQVIRVLAGHLHRPMDAPFAHTRRRWEKTHDHSLIWEGHYAGRETPYCHMEKLANLEQLPAKGFIVSCFPHKIKNGSAGWIRAVALFD